MSALDFPTPTEVGQVYIANGKTWVWDGVSWNNQTAGFSGSKGFTGSIGFTGSRGAGFTGSQGETGFAGSIGGIGFTGSIGIGFTGSRGDTGFVGSQGIIGFSGSQGTIGFTGSQGIQGLQGNIGYTGSQGTQGIQGVQGNIGYTGSQGIQGTTGFTGSQGIQGLQGTVGFTGSQGIQGIQGTIGYTGSQGIQGLQGTTGYTGSQGIQGIQGLVGEGVAAGGVQYDLLQKSSSTDYDTEWTSTPTVDSLIFDTTTGSEVSQLGELLWDADAGTIDVLMNHGVVQNIGEDQYYLVQAAENISKGDVCIAVGTIGESGVILVARSVPVYQTQEIISQQIMGLASSNILQGERGYVQAFGQLRKIDTTAFQQGEILWADPTVAGGLTNTQPEAPNWKTIVALVVARHEQVGALQVRPTFGSSLANDELVHLPSLVDDGILRYNDANSRFELESLGTMADQNSDSVSITGGTIDATLTYDNTVSTLTSTDVKAAIDELDGKVGGLLSANDAMVFKGTLGTGATYTTLPTTYETGWTLKVTQAGTYAGQVAETGDLYIALVDRSGSGNLDSDWTVVQTNIDGAVTGPASSTNDNVALFDGVTGKVIKDSGVSVSAINGLGTMSTQDSDSVSVTGGSIDGVAIGVSAASSGAFTTLSANDDVNFDSGTLFVDASENRVGIGTTSPSYNLEIVGNSSSTISARIRNENSSALGVFVAQNNAGAGCVLGTGGTTYTNIPIFQSKGFVSSQAATDGLLLNAEGTNPVYFSTNNTERMRIDANGNVGIGVTSPNAKLHLNGSSNEDYKILFSEADTPAVSLFYEGSAGSGTSNNFHIRRELSGLEKNLVTVSLNGNVGIGTSSPTHTASISGSSDILSLTSDTSSVYARLFNTGTSTNTPYIGAEDKNMVFGVWGDSEYMRIDSGGRILIGTPTTYADNEILQIAGTDYFTSGMKITRNVNNGGGPHFNFAKSRATSYGQNAIVQINDVLGTIYFRGDDGVDYSTVAAEIVSRVDGTTGANIIPGRLEFRTANSSGTMQERMRITSAGDVGIGTTSPDHKLHIKGDITIDNESSTAPSMLHFNALNKSSLDPTSRINFWEGDAHTGDYANANMFIEYNGSTAGGGDGYLSIGGFTTAANQDILTVNRLGNVGIGIISPSYKLEVNGSFGATSITETSSIRYKENVRELEFNKVISQLRPVIYDRKDGSSKDEVGFIAEEVSVISPNLITKDKDGLVDGIHYTRIIPYLVAKIQELEKTIQELKNG